MITKKAYAKLNLTLEIGDKQEDGYHQLTSVMARATLADTVTVKRNDIGRITFTSTDKEIDPEDNLCTRAAREYMMAKGIDAGVDIELVNNIPVASGMGGGSADCAAVIECMESLFGTLDESVRHSIARGLGADVPYCLLRAPALCRGIGDVCTPIDTADLDGLFLVISKVGEKQSTGKVYSDFDAFERSNVNYDHTLVITALETGDIKAIAKGVFNDFEKVVFPLSPEVCTERERLLAGGAMSVVMSGAGPALVAFFDDREKAEMCGNVYQMIKE